MTGDEIAFLVFIGVCAIGLMVGQIEYYNNMVKINKSLEDQIDKGDAIPHNPPNNDEKQALLDRCIALLRKIKNEGEFYYTCIEFDPYNFDADGIEIGNEISAILEESYKLNKKSNGKINPGN